MRHKSSTPGPPANATPASPSASERLVRDIRRVTRKHYSAEDKIRIVLDGLRGEVTIAERWAAVIAATSCKTLATAPASPLVAAE